MQSYVIALYIRLSLEDSKYDSLSIENQRLVLHEYAAAMPEALHAEVMEFIDNGYSGTNFERPQVQKLIEMVRSNQINCIMVKDFSRFGRNSIETGYFIERVFPLFHTRFISVSDDFDWGYGRCFQVSDKRILQPGYVHQDQKRQVCQDAARGVSKQDLSLRLSQKHRWPHGAGPGNR